jgi:hypothetical protein
MKNQRVKALSISRPVSDVMNREHQAGRVLASYRRACNLVTAGGEIIALVGPAVGNGPLNIVIEDIEVLDWVKPGLLAVFSDDQLVLGDSLVVSLDGAQLWGPEVNWGCLATRRRRLGDNLAALCSWLSQNDIADGLLGLVLNEERESGGRASGNSSPQSRTFLAVAWMGIKGLMQALQDGDRSSIGGSAALLAGLGAGLTPAGDDYLVGLMAGLRVWPGLCEVSSEAACRSILEAAEGRTTLLSRAFLRSAKEGLFGESWHELLAGLAGGEAIRIRQAVRRILSVGATSGGDALAGFLSPYLWQQRLAGRKAPEVL